MEGNTHTIMDGEGKPWTGATQGLDKTTRAGQALKRTMLVGSQLGGDPFALGGGVPSVLKNPMKSRPMERRLDRGAGHGGGAWMRGRRRRRRKPGAPGPYAAGGKGMRQEACGKHEGWGSVESMFGRDFERVGGKI